MHICKQNCGKFIFNAILFANGLQYATVASGELCHGTRQRPKVQPCRLLQMGCIMSPKVQPCRLMQGRSPHIRHLLSASHTIRLPLAYHSVTIRLPLSTSRQGGQHGENLPILNCRTRALRVIVRAKRDKNCQLSIVLLSAVFRWSTSDFSMFIVPNVIRVIVPCQLQLVVPSAMPILA